MTEVTTSDDIVANYERVASTGEMFVSLLLDPEVPITQ
jgi:hypothetical protein